jgi:hypothetical protein
VRKVVTEEDIQEELDGGCGCIDVAERISRLRREEHEVNEE